jgi:hypothetical protein
MSIGKKMEYINIRTPQDDVNKKGSKMWIEMNDNSRAKFCRDLFIKKYGGFFKFEKNNWVWISPVKEHNGYWLKNINTNEKVFFSSMGDFAKNNGMTSVKICELLTGKRKTYKGWTAVETRDVKETTGQHIKQKEPKKKKIAMTKTVLLQNIETNEIINVINIKKFAKQNNIPSSNLYKLVNGKYKTVKNFKLYSPFL